MVVTVVMVVVMVVVVVVTVMVVVVAVTVMVVVTTLCDGLYENTDAAYLNTVLNLPSLLLPDDQVSPVDSSERSHTTDGSESAEWLIILASLLALALILAVCIAVNSRRRCGQKKKLVINNGNGAMEERKSSGLNGEASKSQEMVHLVNKESSEATDQFMTADETRNLQNVDMKIGV
ncbi:CD44 antigen [Camelus dromedarius]|uniref:CD44 antigen n=1 Tax=Camelus dromedarius TaxID=9838 RepID=A0A5N4DLT6_CAMDR|nr:CD44 antigen [Camelus dromedarius]